MEIESDPINLFAQWFAQANTTAIDKPNAMTLSTCNQAGEPSSRIVLLSSFDKSGFVFHTNYLSLKGKEIADNPVVALLFWWDELGYQVRIQGNIVKTDENASNSYFNNRPRGSQLGAWASAQSDVISDRTVLETRMRDFEHKFAGKSVPRPSHWGGYCVKPSTMEFWINRDNRLHDRILYTLKNNQWTHVYLAP